MAEEQAVDGAAPEQPAEPAAVTPPKEAKPDLFVLATQSYLDKQINLEGHVPRLMETVKDSAGNLLIRKYEKLTQAVWQKYRSKPDCKQLHFVCEVPLLVIEEVNATFLLPEEYQFFGALYSLWKNDSVAEQFFNEALKTGTADAYINTAVFWYHRGVQGVMDNYNMAKRYFNKALDILPTMPLSIDEKLKRRKLCEAAIDEIDYRAASFFDKIIRFMIRLLTLHFHTDVPYIGAAKELSGERVQELTESILKQEFEFKKTAVKKFLAGLYGKIPASQNYLEEELREIESDYKGFETPETLEPAAVRLGEFITANSHLIALQYQGPAEPAAAAAPEDADVPLDVFCYELADGGEIEKVAARYKLISLGELLDMTSKQKLDYPVIAWLIRDKFDQTAVMQKLLINSSVPDEVKKVLRRRLPIQ